MVGNELFAAEKLKINFQYPNDYREFIKNRKKIDETSWWLVGEDKGFFDICYRIINSEYKSTKLLIPFAKSDQSNILACFDEFHNVWLTSCETNDITDSDWNNRFFMPSFSAWLDKVLSYEIL